MTIKQNNGFTLIELIVVIVILGILSAVAIPKFINIKRDAIISTMKGLNAALNSASTMAHAKAVIYGVQNEPTATININGTPVNLAYGYPDGTAAGITLLVETPAGDWKQRASTYDGAWVYWHGVIPVDAGTAQCYIRYRQSTTGARPVIDFQQTGCGRY